MGCGDRTGAGRERTNRRSRGRWATTATVKHPLPAAYQLPMLKLIGLVDSEDATVCQDLLHVGDRVVAATINESAGPDHPVFPQPSQLVRLLESGMFPASASIIPRCPLLRPYS